MAVYPRVCGGTDRYGLNPNEIMGLSPRVRGNRHLAPHVRARQGSIPACAGEPRCDDSPDGGSEVYPRVCGGTPGCASRTAEREGLSPRVRGNRPPASARAPRRRSIPACAGEPLFDGAGAAYPRVYPRVCGGTEARTNERRSRVGLSPRVRGNHRASLASPADERSIPACAGEPSRIFGLSCGRKVYPRVCGGTLAGLCPGRVPRGLSPRVRGNHQKSPPVAAE